MPYVRRDESGEIDSVFANAQYAGQEFLPDVHPEIIAFYAHLEAMRNFISIISDRQFYQALAMKGLVTKDEALAAVQTGTIPQALAIRIVQVHSGNFL